MEWKEEKKRMSQNAESAGERGWAKTKEYIWKIRKSKFDGLMDAFFIPGQKKTGQLPLFYPKGFVLWQHP